MAIQHQSTDTSPPTANSYILQTADRLREAHELQEALDKWSMHTPESNDQHRTFDDLAEAARLRICLATAEDAIDALEKAISVVPAATLEEAAVQLMIAASIVDRRDGSNDKECALYASLERLLAFARDVVAREAGIDLARYGHHYGPTRRLHCVIEDVPKWRPDQVPPGQPPAE